MGGKRENYIDGSSSALSAQCYARITLFFSYETLTCYFGFSLRVFLHAAIEYVELTAIVNVGHQFIAVADISPMPVHLRIDIVLDSYCFSNWVAWICTYHS